MRNTSLNHDMTCAIEALLETKRANTYADHKNNNK